MKIISCLKAFFIIIALLILNTSSYSQVVVERSKEKIVISGIPYYIHQVRKGETAYSISKAYGVSVEDLTKENPPALYGVNEGQTLRIPADKVTDLEKTDIVAEKKQHDDNKFIYHNLLPGETVYHLSKSYGVSENEIVQSNPGIDINKLSVGTEIAIPRRQFMTERQKFDVQEKKFIYHKVQKGESLSSIAGKYDLTVRELRKVNRDLRFPQVDDYVRIPVAQTDDVQEIVPVKADSVVAVVEEPVIKVTRPAGYFPVKDLHGSFDVAVLLPFYLEENAERIEIDSSKYLKGKKIYKIVKRNDEWIYPQSLDFIEMYQGILLAADTLRSLGLDINLYPFDIKMDTVEVTRLIESGKLANMDLIIGPVYSYNLTKVADYAKGLNIPVISPVPLINNSALQNNNTLFMSSSSLLIAQKALAKKISENYNDNIVFIHTDTLGIDEDVKQFKSLIFKELNDKLPYEEIKFKEMIFYSRSMFNNDSINRLSHALSELSPNVVVIASEDPPVISETIMDVHGLSKKFDVKVYGYPVMRDLDNLDPKYFFDLDIMVYSPYWIDYNKSDVKQFNSDFRQKFLTEPSEKSYAWQGYDICYFFLSGIAIHGNEFITHPELHNPDLLQTEYNFTRFETINGFENQKLFLVRYTKDYEVRLVEEDKLQIQK
jgi:LysM repeat protein